MGMNQHKALEALDNKNLQSIYKKHYARLESLFAGQSLETPFGLLGISVDTTNPDIDPVKWFSTALSELAEQVPNASDELVFRPMGICYNPRGVHFIDDLFGAEVFLHEFSEQWQAHALGIPVGALEVPDIEKNPSWEKVQKVALLFREYNPQNVRLILPTLSSALNIAVNLYGEEILVAMLTDPAAAHHDLRIINDLIIKLHTWFIDNIPLDRFQPIAMTGRFQPTGHGQICGCTTQLPSNEVYNEFIASLDAEVMSLYQHGGLIHLCGAHTQHIPTWRRMKELKSVQMNDRATLDLPAYFDGLRDDQILYVDYFEDLPLEEALTITNGERTVLIGRFEDSDRETLRRWQATGATKH